MTFMTFMSQYMTTNYYFEKYIGCQKFEKIYFVVCRKKPACVTLIKMSFYCLDRCVLMKAQRSTVAQKKLYKRLFNL